MVQLLWRKMEEKMGKISFDEFVYKLFRDIWLNTETTGYLGSQEFVGAEEAESNIADLLKKAAKFANTLSIEERYPFRMSLMNLRDDIQGHNVKAGLAEVVWECIESVEIIPRTVDELIALYLVPGKLLSVTRHNSILFQNVTSGYVAQAYRMFKDVTPQEQQRFITALGECVVALELDEKAPKEGIAVLRELIRSVQAEQNA